MDNKQQIKQLLGSVNALLGAMRYSASTASGDMANVARYSSYKTFARKYNNLAQQALPLIPETSNLDLFTIEKIKDSGELTWPVQKEIFDSVYSNTALLKSMLEGAIGYAEDETQNLRDFIQANLRRAVFTVPDKEFEVQNGIEALIVGRGMVKGIDYDRETGRVKTSGKESIPDFIFPSLNLCLEVKLSKSADKLKAMVDDINADIRAYSKRYDRQLYIVYDLGIIRDEEEFKRDLEDAPGVSVVVIKH